MSTNRHTDKPHTALGTFIDGIYYTPAEIGTCNRCGIRRRIKPGRDKTGMCQDCRYSELRTQKLEPEPLDVPLTYRAPGGIWRQPPPPMTAEDRAWCYAQEKAFNERRPVIYYRPKAREVAA